MREPHLTDFIHHAAARGMLPVPFAEEWLKEAEPYLLSTKRSIETIFASVTSNLEEPAFGFDLEAITGEGTLQRSQPPRSAGLARESGGAVEPGRRSPSRPDGSDPTTWSIRDIAAGLRRGDLSVTELVEAYLEQIAASESDVRAWELILAEQALAEARRLDEELRRGQDLGPLHGIPFGIKDNIFTKGTPTTAGSAVFRDFVPSYDAHVVKRLRGAGAIVLGKTTTTELALGDPPPTRNPWNLAHTPGGSSSGSAAAVAARHVPFSLATQTGGSINRPASYCGLVALKPTYGRVSRHGVFPVSWTMDHVGAMTRTAVDQAIVMMVLLGPEAVLPGASDASDPGDLWPFVASLEDVADRVKGMRVGRPDRFFFDNLDPSQRAAYDAMLRSLERDLGMIVKDVVLPLSFEAAAAAHTLIMDCEVAAGYGNLLREKGHLMRPILRSRILCGLLTGSDAYIRAQQIRRIYVHQLFDLFNGIDVLATPTTATPAPAGIHRTGSSAFNAPFTISGFPTLVLPTGFASDTALPLSAQFVARPFDEQRLLALAIAYQQVTDWHTHSPGLAAPRQVAEMREELGGASNG